MWGQDFDPHATRRDHFATEWMTSSILFLVEKCRGESPRAPKWKSTGKAEKGGTLHFYYTSCFRVGKIHISKCNFFFRWGDYISKKKEKLKVPNIVRRIHSLWKCQSGPLFTAWTVPPTHPLPIHICRVYTYIVYILYTYIYTIDQTSAASSIR